MEAESSIDASFSVNRIGSARSKSSGVQQSKSRCRGNESGAQKYARRMYAFSTRTVRESFYSREHYGTLAKLFIPQILSSRTKESCPQNVAADFVVLHTIAKRSELREVRPLREIQDLLTTQTSVGNCSQVLFMKGYPEPEWLCHIGATYDLDPEYLVEHFANAAQPGVEQNYCLPLPLMGGTNRMCLTVTNIGSWDNHKSNVPLDTLRQACDREMEEYLNDWNRSRGIKPGDSMIRSFFLHDRHNFFLEQKISIILKLHAGSTWTLIVWTDTGNALDQSHRGPWLDIQGEHSSSTRFLPLAIHRTGRLPTLANRVGESTQAAGLAQAASWLPTELGKSLDPEIMSEDPFYCLTEVYLMAAAAEHQFINLIQAKIEAMARFEEGEQNKIAELQRTKRVVGQHVTRIQEILDTTLERGGPKWPHSDALEAKEVADNLQRTYTSLLRRAEAAMRECKDSMSVLSNEAMVREAQKSIEQAESVAKVTFIAFLFVPVSFTTGFFGMNFAELNPGSRLGVWVWFAVSVPTLLFSLVLWQLDGRDVRRVWGWVRRGVCGGLKGDVEGKGEVLERKWTGE